MKSNLLSKSESAQLLADVSESWGMPLPSTKNIMVHDLGGGASLAVGSGFRALSIGGAAGAERDGGASDGGAQGRGRPPRYLPFLSEHDLLGRFPAVTVDMGAVRFVCKGANVMRPGIRDMGRFGAGDIVCVREESRGKYLSVGTAALSDSDAAAAERGLVVANHHYVSDRYWEAARLVQGR